MGKIFLCIHGHFYQPPRENPWTDEIEVEPSAAPFHDWNERIYQECYKPNSEAVIVDNNGYVLERINNYENISFNFGPTLLSWMKEKHLKTYNKIIKADKKSVNEHNGHGNAIAQVYNHLIMPLAKHQDKITQVKWGLRDFEYNFGRKSEGIWLAETACNRETIEVLINEGIKFIILDPSQAMRIKKFNEKEWQDVSFNNINPKFPYRIFSEKTSDKFIDVFFYDGPLSKNIAFDDVIFSAERLIERIEDLKIQNNDNYQILSMAVDGETFGHHKKFTERTIAFLLTKLAPQKNLKVGNYGEFLELCPPEYEVELKSGINGEGTSWSCIHGVSRWIDDCGCTTGSRYGWNQLWRKPLRDALDNLRDKLDLIYSNIGIKYFKNIAEARNEYINVINDNSTESINIFFDRNSKYKLKEDEKSTCLKLLEMQKYSLLMFTSCGWFFADISGIETVKILEYANRSIEIAEELSSENLEINFMEELANAKSNIPEFINGKEIYKRIKSN